MGVAEFDESHFVRAALEESVSSPTSAMEIARAVALRHGVKVNDVLGSRLRQRHLTAARREISHKLREIGWSYPAIGDFLHRDHTSVMNLVKGRSEARRQREKIRWATREVVQ